MDPYFETSGGASTETPSRHPPGPQPYRVQMLDNGHPEAFGGLFGSVFLSMSGVGSMGEDQLDLETLQTKSLTAFIKNNVAVFST